MKLPSRWGCLFPLRQGNVNNKLCPKKVLSSYFRTGVRFPSAPPLKKSLLSTKAKVISSSIWGKIPQKQAFKATCAADHTVQVAFFRFQREKTVVYFWSIFASTKMYDLGAGGWIWTWYYSKPTPATITDTVIDTISKSAIEEKLQTWKGSRRQNKKPSREGWPGR